jgi:hypothetical protein
MSADAPRQFDDPSVWRADEIDGKQGLVRPLGGAVLDEIAELLESTADRPLLELWPEHFRGPALENLAHACRRELAEGRGALILTGLDGERLPLEDFRRIYWFFGQLIGRPVPQSDKGDVIGYVRQEPDGAPMRGYTSNIELGFHSDFYEVLSLASVQTALEGGESWLVSTGYIHNVMLAECPDLLGALYTGWYDAIEAFWFRELRPKDRLSDEKLPYFSVAGGKVSFNSSVLADLAAQERGEPVPAALLEALAAVNEIADRPGVAARFMLQPGEMQFWDNFAFMHGRSEFRNAPGRGRLLMRRWMRAHDTRPKVKALSDRIDAIDRMVAQVVRQAQQPAPA